MKITVTLPEVAAIIADRHSVSPSQVEVVGLPVPAPLGPRMIWPEPLLTMEDVVSYIRTGDKIAAIKRFKTTFNVGLKEAKDVVEYLANNIRNY